MQNHADQLYSDYSLNYAAVFAGFFMPLPIIPIISGAIVQVFTKPWPWALFGGWLLVSNFDFGLFKKEVTEIVASLWWVVVLIILGMIAISMLKIYVSEREVTKRKKSR